MNLPADPKAILARIRARASAQPLVKTAYAGEGPEAIGDITTRANAAVRAWNEEPGHRVELTVTPREVETQMVEPAARDHAFSWAHVEDDVEAFMLLRDMAIEAAKRGDVYWESMLAHLSASDAFDGFGWQAKWYHYGCQSFEVDDRYAASLAATTISKSELDFVRLPWPCFVLRAPPFLQKLHVRGEPVKLIVVNHLRFPPGSGLGDQYRLSLITPNRFRFLPTPDLGSWACPRVARTTFDAFELAENELAEYEQRQIELVSRFALGVVIAMNDEKAHRVYHKTPGRKSLLGSPRYGTHPSVVLHTIGKPVKVDAREELLAWATGARRSKPSVRTLVAGHWKNQVHGPGNALRRWQHVECYWRGPEDGPMVVRPHVMTGNGKE